MRTASLVLLILALVGGPRPAAACGAKTLPTFAPQGAGSVYCRLPANVVVYSQTESKGVSNVAKRSMRRALQRAGHQVHLCTAPDVCTEVLSGGFDVIVADANDMPALRDLVKDKGVQPAFLPVVFKATKKELSRLRKTYGVVLNAPASPADFLYLINQVLTPN